MIYLANTVTSYKIYAINTLDGLNSGNVQCLYFKLNIRYRNIPFQVVLQVTFLLSSKGHLIHLSTTKVR